MAGPGKEQNFEYVKDGGQAKGAQFSSQCLSKTSKIPQVQVKSKGMGPHTQYMKYHALIRKFVGIWPPEKTLIWWINTTWKPNGNYDLQLGAKGFFTIIFLNLEDKKRVFHGGHYFKNLVGLYLTLWKERFNRDKVDLSVALLYLRLYSLAAEFWHPEILEDIGNALGSFVNEAEQTK